MKHLLPVALYSARLFAKKCRQGHADIPRNTKVRVGVAIRGEVGGWGGGGGREGVVVVVGALSQHHAVKNRSLCIKMGSYEAIFFLPVGDKGQRRVSIKHNP